MEQHKGKIVEEAIKKSGFQMKALANKLGIARNTLYTRLKEADIKDAFIIEISKIIHYDFSSDFPDIYRKNENNNRSLDYDHREDNEKIINDSAITRDPYFNKLQELNKKYLKLMEDYNKLLQILIVLANDNELVDIKQDIIEFIKNNQEQKN